MGFFDSMAQAAATFVMTVGLQLLEAAVAVFIGVRFARWLTKWVGDAKFFDKLDTNLRGFLQSSVSIVVYTLLIMIVCGIIGVDTASLITVLASCGVAVGLAMQGALSNVAGGLMLLALHPFHVGDYVEVTGIGGTVKGIGLFSTIINTPDNKTITVPNGSITSATITNFSNNGNRRVDMTFSAGYDVPVQVVKETIMTVAQNHKKVLRDPAPFVRLSKQDNSALVYTLRVWVKTADYWDVHFDLLEEMTKAFQNKNITIPYPQMDVHLDK